MATLSPKKEKVPDKAPELRTVQEVFGMYAVSAGTSTRGVAPVSTTNDDLLCGIELEIENLREGHGFYQEVAGDFWAVEEDGSLRPRGESWEFISAPCRLAQLVAETDRLFGQIDVREDRNYSDRCSVHLHTNVQDWTQQQVAVLAMVYPVFEGVLFKFVNHYKKKEEQGYCRDTNLYCIPWSDCRHNRNFVENLFNNPGQIRNWQKYTALNFLPIQEKGTVEWRHMHGTCDMEKLTIWFNVIGAIMKYCKNTAFETVVDVLRKMNDVSAYQQWFEEVLMRTLPYDEEYRRLMAEGVVNAKYSLINLDANKGKPKKKNLLGDYWTVEGFDNQPLQPPEWLEPAVDVQIQGGRLDIQNPRPQGAAIFRAEEARQVPQVAPINRAAEQIRAAREQLERERRVQPPAPRDPFAPRRR